MMKNKYSLTGIDGNAFCVMGYVRDVMDECGYSKKEIGTYLDDARSSDYAHLIVVSMGMLDRCNERCA